MVIRYKYSDLKNPQRFGRSGHETSFATYQPEPPVIRTDDDFSDSDDVGIGTNDTNTTQQPQGIKVIYKANKHGRAKASLYEVAFSEIARLHMMPDITPVPTLCVDDEDNIVGVCSEDICYALARRHPDPETFPENTLYSLNLNSDGTKYECVVPTNANDSHKEPYHFLKDMPNGFFDELLAAHNNPQKHHKIDMETLASSLVGKYVLEEDDLHKGNLGIYTRIVEGIKVVHFFNIDHDLLMSGSITSFFDHRGPNFTYGVTDYQITPRDLLNFPDLKDSQNHYWPTRKRLMVLPGDKKIYDHGKEREAFAKLKYDKEFQRYKWKYLLKSAILPPELTDMALQKHLDINHSGQNQDRMLISQALAERQSQLRAALFSLNEFRLYLKTDEGKQDIDDIKKQLTQYNEDKVSHLNVILDSLHDAFKTGCKVKDTDTPLQVALRLQDYRFEQTLMLYGGDINTPNKMHLPEWPVDIVANQINDYVGKTPETRNPSRDPILVMQHLLKNGARLTDNARRILNENNFTIRGHKIGKLQTTDGRRQFIPHTFSYYLSPTVRCYDTLLLAISTIGQDPHLSLKTKKELTVDLVRKTRHHLSTENWNKFKRALNGHDGHDGHDGHPILPSLKFLHQLRSTLWIIRWLRGGLYGRTSSVSKLNRMLTLGPSVIHNPVPWPDDEQSQSEGVNRALMSNSITPC